MAFIKVLALAACLALSAAAPSPQLLHAVPATASIHSVGQPAAIVRHAPVVQQVHTLSHPAAPAVVRTVTHQAAPAVVRTVTHQAAPAVVRTVTHQAAPAVVRTVAHPAPTVVRTVPVATAAYEEEVEEEVIDENPSYTFGYSVADARSGDSKTRSEELEDGVVRGSYSVADPDGRIRVVEYTADKENGFQATVTYDGEPGPVAIPFDAPVASAAVVAAQPAEQVQLVEARDQLEESQESEADAAPAVHAAVLPAAATHFVHAAPAATRFFHAAPATARHVVHAAPPTATHLIHAAPATTQVVRTDAQHVIQPTVLRNFPTFSSPLPVGTQFVQV